MSKLFKKFSSHDIYLQYKDNFNENNTPNITKCIDDIHYQKKVKYYDKEIEYLESTGTQWIDTGIIPYTYTKVQFKFKNMESTGDVIIGYNNGNDKEDWRFFNYDQCAYFDLPFEYGNSEGKRIHTNTNEYRIYQNHLYELELGNFYVKNLETNTNIITGEFNMFKCIDTIKLNYYLGNNENKCSENKFYYAKIYDNDILVRDLIPVRKDGIGYMYDKVNKELFGNSGTGDFILGPDI